MVTWKNFKLKIARNTVAKQIGLQGFPSLNNYGQRICRTKTLTTLSISWRSFPCASIKLLAFDPNNADDNLPSS